MTGQLAPPRHLREASSRQPTLEKPALLCPLVQAVLGNESMGVQRTTLGTHRVRGQDGATLDAYQLHRCAYQQQEFEEHFISEILNRPPEKA